MPGIKLQGFSGLVPRASAALLPDGAASIANNVKLQSGEIRPWRANTPVFTPKTLNTETIYKLHGAGLDFEWLEWEKDVNVVPGPVNDTSDFRVYYTGDGTPKKTNYTMASGGTDAKPRTWLNMGVPAPTTAPTLVSAGGTVPEDRGYYYTNVSTFGAVKEESGPGPASLVTTNASGATVTISGFQAPPAGAYNITHRRIYRTLAGNNTVSYLFVAEIPATQTSFADFKISSQLGDVSVVDDYLTPPDNMIGLVAMSNGMLAGFFDNTVCFCEPYLPHTWPEKYRYTVDSKIVGLGVFNNTLVVATQSNPVLISGTNPGAMSQERLPMTQPCLSKNSIASDQNGVVYAGFEGLVGIGPGTQGVLTKALYTRDEWQLLNPTTMVGEYYNGFYFGFYSGLKSGCVILSRDDTPALTEYSFSAGPIFVDSRTGELFALNLDDDQVYKFDADELNNVSYEWKSKLFILPQPINIAALQVDADFRYMYDTEAINAIKEQIRASNEILFNNAAGSLNGDFNAVLWNTFVLNGSALTDPPTLAESRNIRVFVYADGVLRFSTSVLNRDPIRMPSGYKAAEWEIRFTGNSPMRTFSMATSVAELKGM